MARAKRGFKARRRRKKILKEARGFFGARSRQIRAAVETVRRARNYSTRHRKLRKRDFRSLWIERLSAAAREQGISYSRLIGQLVKANVGINRKMLSELAIHDPGAFRQLIAVAKGA